MLLSLSVSAAPFTPKDDALVLETLPKTQLFQNSEVNTLRQQLKNAPNNIDVAAQLAKLYIETGRSESDPRYFGYAQAILSPWWQQQEAPTKILFLRATLNQGLHRFAEAEADLKQLLLRNRRDHQAWWLLATLYSAQGKHQKTEASCSALGKVVHHTISSLCYAMLWSRTGNAGKAHRILQLHIPQLAREPSLQAWAITLQAEISSQLDQPEQAEHEFKRALSITTRAPYLLKLYADHLLWQGNHKQVLSLTQDWTHDLALAIRAAIAANISGDKKRLNQLKTQLNATFELERLRGSNLHQREAALYQLEIKQDKNTALALAKANWQTQKEPEDAYILLKAATAMKDTDTITRIKNWLDQTKLEDKRIQHLLRQALIS